MQTEVNKFIERSSWEQGHELYVVDNNLFNHPIKSYILLVLFGSSLPSLTTSVVNQIFVGALGNPLSRITNATDIASETIRQSADQVLNADTPYMLTYSIVSILTMVFLAWWFKMRFKNADYEGIIVLRNFGRACLIALPGLLFVALNFFSVNIGNFKIGILLLGFIPAFTEEIAFRGLVIPNWMRVWNKKSGIWLSLFVTSAVFGLFHAANILVGADVGTTLFQVFYAFALGMLLAGIVIRTGTLWPCILIHGLMDFSAFLGNEAMYQGAVQTQGFEFGWDVIPVLVLSAFYIVYAIIICRPSKHNEILELWKNKWGPALLV